MDCLLSYIEHQKVKMEAQELRLESHERTLESQHTMFELNRGDIDCLNKRTKQQNKTLERHGEQIEQQGRVMEAHTAQLEQLTNQLPAVLHATSDGTVLNKYWEHPSPIYKFYIIVFSETRTGITV